MASPYLTTKEYRARYLNDGLLGLAKLLRGDDAAFKDGFFWYGKVGYQMKALSVGSTAFSVGYGEYDDLKAGNSLTNMYEATSWGAEMVQKFDAINTDFYLVIACMSWMHTIA